jgi:hypothetical protein
MKTVPITVEVSVGKQKFSEDTEKIVFEDRDDILNAITTDKGLADLLADINYAKDLEVRGKVRQEILNGKAAAANSFEKSVKDFFNMRRDNGDPVTMDEAREMMEMMKSMRKPAKATA